MKKAGLVIFLFIIFCNAAGAQDSLPNIHVVRIHNNVLVKWNNQFTSITSISIQRSADSTHNFQTIGEAWNVRNKTDGFVDHDPAGVMFYRLFLTFYGGSYMFTEAHRPVADSADVLPASFKTVEIKPNFPPSKYIYTGKDNNAVIDLPEQGKKKYSIKFLDENSDFLFEINPVPEPYLILEKVNFRRSGIVNFELYEDGKLKERYKIYIPKDPKKER